MAVTYQDIFDRYMVQEINQVTMDLTFNIYTSGYLKQYHWYKILKVGSQCLYLYLPRDAKKKKLNTNFLEKQLSIIATMRKLSVTSRLSNM